jgi:hypothetical protein
MDNITENFRQNKILYNENYIKKNKERLKEKITCDICNKQYQRWNKYAHNKTKFHRQHIF